MDPCGPHTRERGELGFPYPVSGYQPESLCIAMAAASSSSNAAIYLVEVPDSPDTPSPSTPPTLRRRLTAGGSAAERSHSDPIKLRSARGDPNRYAPALPGGRTALALHGEPSRTSALPAPGVATAETSLVAVAFSTLVVRPRRFLQPHVSDPGPTSDLIRWRKLPQNAKELLLGKANRS